MTLLTTSEAAAMLGISRTRVVHLIAQGTLVPVSRAGRVYLLSPADVRALVAKRRALASRDHRFKEPPT